jgi:hypothetical protein
LKHFGWHCYLQLKAGAGHNLKAKKRGGEEKRGRKKERKVEEEVE